MTARDSNDTTSHNSGVAGPDESLSADRSLLTRLVAAATPADASLSLTEDELFECLSARRRRKLIRLLAGLYDPDGETYIEVRELADIFARAQYDRPDAQESKAFYVSFIQTHLPVLDDLGLVEYYERPKKVEATAEIVAVADVMRSAAEACESDGQERSGVMEVER